MQKIIKLIAKFVFIFVRKYILKYLMQISKAINFVFKIQKY